MANRNVVAIRLTGSRMKLVFGCSEEKDITKLMEPFIPFVDTLYITKANNWRAAKTSLIEDRLKDFIINKKIAIPVSAAIESAISDSTDKDMICIFGSLFIIGEAREFLLDTFEEKNHHRSAHRFHY